MSAIKRLLIKFFRLFKFLLFVTKIPGYVIWFLDYLFGKISKFLGATARFVDGVMLRPCHNTRIYKWYKTLDDSPRLALWVVMVTVVWIFSGAGGDGRSFGGNKDADETLRSVQVKTFTAQNYQPLVEISGITEADHKLEILAQTTGTVKNIVKPKGSFLTADDVFLELDNAVREAELKQAQASYNQLELENKAAASLARGGYQSQVKANEIRANFARAEAQLAQARYNLAKSQFSAPFAGTLVDSPLDIGDFVSPGTFVGTVIDLNPIKINGFVSEKEVQNLQGLGDVGVTIDDQEYRGELVFISSSANSRTRSFAVEVVVDNQENTIRDGVPANLFLPQAERQAHFISSAWLTLNSDGAVGVRLVNDEDKVVFMAVEIVADSDLGVWVAGLPETIKVITVGQETVTEGEQVEAVVQE